MQIVGFLMRRLVCHFLILNEHQICTLVCSLLILLGFDFTISILVEYIRFLLVENNVSTGILGLVPNSKITMFLDLGYLLYHFRDMIDSKDPDQVTNFYYTWSGILLCLSMNSHFS